MTFPTYYILVHDSGTVIPHPIFRAGRGGSYVEPIEPSSRKGHRPRLFGTKQSASSWLTIWCKGQVVAKFIETENGQEADGNDYVPVASRIRVEFRIVPVTLTEVLHD